MSEPRAEADAHFSRDREAASPEYRWTLITVSHNSAAALRRYWEGVELPADVEWVVVDNASIDDSREIASKLGARVICNEQNIGFGAACNVGFYASSSQYVGFVNPDVTIEPSQLAALAELIGCNTRRLVAPQLMYPDGALQANGRGLPTLAAKLAHRYLPRLSEGRYRRYAEPGEIANCHWMLGAVLCGERSWLSELGPWDESYFLYYEDTDLGIRNKKLGGSNLVTGDVRWVHGLAWRTRSLRSSSWRLALPSMLRFYRRYWNLALGLAGGLRRC